MTRNNTKSQLLRYGVVGVGNTIVGAALVFGLHNLAGASIFMANVVGYGVGLCLSYVLNRFWTFSARRTRAGSAFRFGALVCLALGANIATTILLTDLGMAYNPAQVIGMVLYSTLVFIGSKLIVFPPDKEIHP